MVPCCAGNLAHKADLAAKHRAQLNFCKGGSRRRDTVSALAAQTEKLGPYAFAGGKAAVQEETRAALKDASSVVGEAAREAASPVKEALSAGAAAIGAAQDSLLQALRRFSWRMLAMGGAVAFGAFTFAGFGGFAMIGWQRVEVASEREELVQLQNRKPEVGVTVAEMEKRGRELDAKGVRFETTRCQEEKGGKTRLCAEIDRKAPEYSADEGRRQFRVPMRGCRPSDLLLTLSSLTCYPWTKWISSRAFEAGRPVSTTFPIW